MKVRDLLEEIKRNKKLHKDFLEYDVYSEQISACKKDLQQTGNLIRDSEDWEYFKCNGFYTLFTKEKIFAMNVNRYT